MTGHDPRNTKLEEYIKSEPFNQITWKLNINPHTHEIKDCNSRNMPHVLLESDGTKGNTKPEWNLGG